MQEEDVSKSGTYSDTEFHTNTAPSQIQLSGSDKGGGGGGDTGRAAETIVELSMQTTESDTSSTGLSQPDCVSQQQSLGSDLDMDLNVADFFLESSVFIAKSQHCESVLSGSETHRFPRVIRDVCEMVDYCAEQQRQHGSILRTHSLSERAASSLSSSSAEHVVPGNDDSFQKNNRHYFIFQAIPAFIRALTCNT